MTDHEPVGDLESLQRQIAEMHTREIALAAQQELLENLIALARSAPEASMLEATLQKMLDVSTRMTGASSGSLFLLDERGVVTNSILTRGQATFEQRSSAEIEWAASCSGARCAQCSRGWAWMVICGRWIDCWLLQSRRLLSQGGGRLRTPRNCLKRGA